MASTPPLSSSAASSSWPPPRRQPAVAAAPSSSMRQAHTSSSPQQQAARQPVPGQQQHPPLPPALQHLAAHDLATGTGGYANLQPVLRQTFAALMDAAAASHAQVAALEARMARQEARRREEGEASAVALRTVRTLLDSHVEALRAEFAPRLKGLEAQCAALGDEVKARRSSKAPEETRIVEAALTRRVELLQGEVVRLARVVDSKADGSEVEAALRLRVSKASLGKRMEAILLHGEEGTGEEGGKKPTPLLAGLRRRVDSVEGKMGEQERAVRRLGKEVEAVRSHVVGSSGGKGGEGKEGFTGVLKGLQTVLEQQGRRVQRAEKEVAALKEKVVRELALVEGRVEERVRGGGGEAGGVAPVVEESLKAFEAEIVKELDARDGELRRQLEGAVGLVREVEARVEQDVGARLARVEEAGGFQDSQRVLLAERMHRLERQLQLATETSTALGQQQGLPRPSSRGSVGGSGSGGRAVPPPLSTVALGVGVGAPVSAMVAAAEEPETPDPTRRDHTLRHQHQHGLPPAVGSPPALSQSQQQPPPQASATTRFIPATSAAATGIGARGSSGGSVSLVGLEAIPASALPAPTPTTPLPVTAATARPLEGATLRHAGGAGGPSSFFFQQDSLATGRSAGEAGGAADSSLRSFWSVGGGGMPTIWRGTGTVGLGDEPVLAASAASIAGVTQQQQQLETLRREKLMLRTRIQQGLLTLSQSSPARPPTPQQQQHHMSRSAGASVGGTRGVGGLEGAHGSVSSMV